MVAPIETLTSEQDAAASAHARRCAEIGLRTGSADRGAFEEAARQCYRYAQVRWHSNVIWVSSPLVLALAAPAASLLIQLRRKGFCVPESTIGDVVGLVLEGHVGDAVRPAVEQAVAKAVEAAVSAAIAGTKRIPRGRQLTFGGLSAAKSHALDHMTRRRISAAVHHKVFAALITQVAGAVFDRVDGRMRATAEWSAALAVSRGVAGAVGAVVERSRDHYDHEPRTVAQAILEAMPEIAAQSIGGPVSTRREQWDHWLIGFFRCECPVRLDGNLWDRWQAYETTARSAGWWYPHHRFLMVCERPLEIYHARIGHSRAGLHRADGPAVLWRDGWEIYAFNGRRMPAWVIEHPERINVLSIEEERNSEVRRAMIERYGWSRYISDCGAELVDRVPDDHPIVGLRGARLLRKYLPTEGEPIVYLEMVNSTPEPDGTFRKHMERIDPRAYGWEASVRCQAAMASRWFYRDGNGRLRRTFERWQDYWPSQES